MAMRDTLYGFIHQLIAFAFVLRDIMTGLSRSTPIQVK